MSIDRYQLAEKLGQGGMGVVHKVKDLWTGEWVAIKTMTGFPDDDEHDQKARERFEREIKMARSLQHEHILPIIDDGYRWYNYRLVPYLVTPYMPDGSLDRLTKDKETPPWVHWTLPQTADVIMQAASGLDYMHRHTPPKVHEDVKPENLLIHREPGPDRIVHLYVTDFGIAREQRTSSPIVSQVIGTTPFMAPEQFEQRIHHASDQYALAIVACLLLTGKLPLQASTIEQWMYAHINKAPMPPSILNPQRVSSAEVDRIILRALSKRPEERFPSILEFANALYRALVAPNAEERTDSFIPAPIPPARQSLPHAPLVPPPVPTIRAASTPLQPPASSMSSVVPPSASPLVAPVPAPASELPGILQYPIKPPIEEVDEPLPFLPANVSPARAEVTLPPFYLLVQSFSKELGARPRMLAWSPDGDYLIGTFHEQSPVLINREGWIEVLEAVGRMGTTAAICWSPDSRVLAISYAGERYSEIRFWDVVSQSVCFQPLRFPTPTIYGLDWSARGQLAVWVGSQIMIYTLPDIAPASFQLPPPYTLPIQAMRGSDAIGILHWSPDGSLLAAGAQDGALICWNTDTQMLQWTESASSQTVQSLTWYADNALLGVAFRNKRVVVWNVRKRRQLTTWEKLPVVPRALSFAAQQRLTIASEKPYLLFGDISAAFPSARLVGYWVAAWSPEGRELATLDGRSRTTLFVWRE